MRTDRHNAAKTERHHAKGCRSKCVQKHSKDADHSTSKNYFLFEEHRNPIFEYRANTISIEHSDHLLLGLSHRDRE